MRFIVQDFVLLRKKLTGSSENEVLSVKLEELKCIYIEMEGV